MTGRGASRPLRKAVWWSIGVRVAGVLLLALCAAAGIRVGSTARLALELATTVPLIFLVTRTATACIRYRRGGLTWRAALYAVAADVVSVPVLRLMIHEFRLYTSILRWLAGRWRHGVREGDIAVRYASGSAALLLTFAYVSFIETVVLAFLIPWPLVREITLGLDLWGVFFVLGLFASFVVRPMSSARTARCGCAPAPFSTSGSRPATSPPSGPNAGPRAAGEGPLTMTDVPTSPKAARRQSPWNSPGR
jgi:hypothetical protein